MGKSHVDTVGEDHNCLNSGKPVSSANFLLLGTKYAPHLGRRYYSLSIRLKLTEDTFQIRVNWTRTCANFETFRLSAAADYELQRQRYRRCCSSHQREAWTVDGSGESGGSDSESVRVWTDFAAVDIWRKLQGAVIEKRQNRNNITNITKHIWS